MKIGRAPQARRSLSAASRTALAWWLGELTSLVPASVRPRQGRRSDIEIRITREQWTVEARGAPARSVDSQDGAQVTATLAEIRGQRKQMAATLVIPLSRCFSRSTALPRAMLGHARSILTSELEANTPFLAEAVYWDWFVRRESDEPGVLDLTQIVLKRRDIDPVARVLTAAGFGVAAIAVEDDTTASAPVRLPVDLQRYARRGSDEASQSLRKARGVLIGAAVLTGVAIVPAAFYQQASTLAALDAELADAGDAVAARPGLSRAQLQALGNALEEKRGGPSAAQVMDALATVLPPDSDLEHLYLDHDVLTIQGRTGSTRALERALSASPLFNVGHNTAAVAKDGGLSPFTIRLKTRPAPMASGA